LRQKLLFQPSLLRKYSYFTPPAIHKQFAAPSYQKISSQENNCTPRASEKCWLAGYGRFGVRRDSKKQTLFAPSLKVLICAEKDAI